MPITTTLGSEHNTAFIYSRDGREELLQLRPSALDYGRELSSISKGNVTIPSARCSPKLDRVEPWAHSLVFYRGSERAWEGPIRRMEHVSGGLQIGASDVLGWLERRPIRAKRVTASNGVVSELQLVIQAAFGTDDPNVLAYLQRIGGTGAAVPRDLAALSGYADSELGNLTGLGARYTVVGRRIVLWAEATSIGSLPELLPEKHLQAEVKVIQDGDLLATEVISRDDNAAYAGWPTTPAEYVDPFYGHVSQLVTLSGQHKRPALLQAAKSARAQGYPSQYVIEVPGDAALRPDAPFPLELLVPGVTAPLSTTTATGKRVQATFQLSSMKVSQVAQQTESVTVTVAPLSTTAVA